LFEKAKSTARPEGREGLFLLVPGPPEWWPRQENQKPSRTSRLRGGSCRCLIELLLEQGVQGAGVALALQVLHCLADEEAEQVLLAGPVLLDLAGVARDHRVDHRFEGTSVADLGEALGLDDLRRRDAGAQRLAEHFLRRRRRDGPGV